MNKRESIKQWQNSVNVDYLSLYMKTWFAFLATVQELHPDAVTGKGDKDVIKSYVDNITVPKEINNFSYELHQTYKHGYDIFKNQQPNIFFGLYFDINKLFSEKISFKKHILQIKYRDKLGDEGEPNLLFQFNTEIKKFKSNIGNHYIVTNIPISKFINEEYEKDQLFAFLSSENTIRLIENHLLNEVETIIRNTKARKFDEKIAYCKGEVDLIVQNIRSNNKDVFNNLFIHKVHKDYYDNGKIVDNEIKLLKWFINFNYQVRNLLFHSVINPFDPQWLLLFKFSYLVLEQLVEHNLEEIDQKPWREAIIT